MARACTMAFDPPIPAPRRCGLHRALDNFELIPILSAFFFLWGSLCSKSGGGRPFGADSLSPENAVYMSTEQVLADYAQLLTTV